MLKYRNFLIGILINFILLIAICVMVDPYGFYRVFEKKRFNQQKEGVRSVIRYVKAVEISLRKPEAILMGSSRVHDGINPDNFPFAKFGVVYNYGIDMLRINEAKAYLVHALKNSQIKHVYFGLDFFMFNALEKYNPTFDNGLVGRKINMLDLIKPALPSKFMIGDMYSTIKVSRSQPDRKEFLVNGYRPGSSVFFHLIDYKKLHYYTNWIFLSDSKNGTPYYGKYRQDEQSFNCFEDFLKICRDNNIKCTLFITPAHALLDGEGIYLSNLWEKMEIFKIKVTKIAKIYQTPIWDFSGYNYITTEKVKTPMKYYWDSSHYSEYVGNLMVKQMLSPESKDPAYFGKLLSNDNIRSHLQKIREDRLKYIKENPEEIAWINQLYQKIKANEALPKEQTENIFAP